VKDRKRVLFVCVGNACRSQMAEGFARAYGSDVLVPASAGLAPAAMLPRETLRAMAEKNLDISSQFPKSLAHLGGLEFDLIINMSGYSLPMESATPLREWEIPDPIGKHYEEHRVIRDQIENLVLELILESRREQEQ